MATIDRTNAKHRMVRLVLDRLLHPAVLGVLTITAFAASFTLVVVTLVCAGPATVDLALVLAVDTSLSISAQDHRLQLDGYAAAFRDHNVLKAITDGGAHGAIAVTVLEWSNMDAPLQTADWMLVSDVASAEAFATKLERLSYRPSTGTSIGSAIEYSHRLLDEVPYVPVRRVIDVSSDGKSMNRSRLDAARQAALDAGITINGLPIRGRYQDLPAYFAKWVIGGPGSFLVIAEGFPSFDRAVRQKLVLEIAGAASNSRLAFQ